MNIISAKTHREEKLYLAVIDEGFIWTTDVSKMKVFRTPDEAAIILYQLLDECNTFENFNIAASTSIKICTMVEKELY